MELCELYKYVPSHILNGCLLISLAQEESLTVDEGPVLPVSIFYTGIDYYVTTFRFVTLPDVTPQSLLESNGIMIEKNYGLLGSRMKDHSYSVASHGTIAISDNIRADTVIWLEPHVHMVPNLPPITIHVSNIHNKACTHLYVLMLQRGGNSLLLDPTAFALLPAETMGPDVDWIIDVGRGEMHLEGMGVISRELLTWDPPLQPDDVLIPMIYVYHPCTITLK
eukprot:PhF_6_TR14936/c1_g1_i10/m.23388